MYKSAEKILEYLIRLLELYLEELNGDEASEFSLGEKIAFAECLEIIQNWEKAGTYGLDYDVEERFPIK